MNLLRERFAAEKREKRCGFIPFIVAGHPNLETTAQLLRSLATLQPSAIELGVPFSDPTADGPTIQRASQHALGQGISLAKIFGMLEKMPNESAPIVLFSYYNPILQFGLARFAQRARTCGVAGVLVVDLPAEAAAPLQRELRQKSIDLIFLVTPTTSDARLKQIARLASGFIYAVARTGVTGNASASIDESAQLVARVRKVSDLPVAVGFGITNRQQACRICRYADAAVVGSRLVAEIENASAHKRKLDLRSVLECARQFV